PLVPEQRHQRTEVAFLHEIIRTLQALQVSRRCGGGHSALFHRRTQVVGAVESRQLLTPLYRPPQKRAHSRLGPGARRGTPCSSALFLSGQFINHHIDGLYPAGQELARVQSRGGLLSKRTLLDQDNVNAARDGGFGSTEAGQATSDHKQLAAQALVGAGERRKPNLIAIGRVLNHHRPRRRHSLPKPWDVVAWWHGCRWQAREIVASQRYGACDTTSKRGPSR